MIKLVFVFLAGWSACYFYFFFIFWNRTETKVRRKAGIILDSMFDAKQIGPTKVKIDFDRTKKLSYAEALNWAAMVCRMVGHADAICRIEAREKEIRGMVK